MSFLLRLLAAPAIAFAQDCECLPGARCVCLTTGIRVALVTVISNLTAFLAYSAAGICTLLFLLGAAQLVISRGDQTKVDNGKKMMIGALVGLAIVLSAWAIVRTLLYFLYLPVPDLPVPAPPGA